MIVSQRQAGAEVYHRLVFGERLGQSCGRSRGAELVELQGAVVQDDDEVVASGNQVDMFDGVVAVEVPDQPGVVVQRMPESIQPGCLQDLVLELLQGHLLQTARELWLREA